MSLVKYRLKEVASDFGVTPKEIAEIISKFYEKPKSNTQALTDEELNVVFECMTQNHQIQSLEQVFAMAKPKEQPKAEPVKPAAEQTVARVKIATSAHKSFTTEYFFIVISPFHIYLSL